MIKIELTIQIKDLFITLGRCGVITSESVKQYLNLSEIELENLVNEGYLFSEIIKIGFKNTKIYYLTDKSKGYIRCNLSNYVKNIYSSFIKKHDICLCDFYLERTEEEKETWNTRDYITNRYNKDGLLSGSLDGCFDDNDCKVFIKCLDSKSKFNDIERTEKFLEKIGFNKIIYLFYK